MLDKYQTELAECGEALDNGKLAQEAYQKGIERIKGEWAAAIARAQGEHRQRLALQTKNEELLHQMQWLQEQQDKLQLECVRSQGTTSRLQQEVLEV